VPIGHNRDFASKTVWNVSRSFVRLSGKILDHGCSWQLAAHERCRISAMIGHTFFKRQASVIRHCALSCAPLDASVAEIQTGFIAGLTTAKCLLITTSNFELGANTARTKSDAGFTKSLATRSIRVGY
jgi:hypothetical protein